MPGNSFYCHSLTETASFSSVVRFLFGLVAQAYNMSKVPHCSYHTTRGDRLQHNLGNCKNTHTDLYWVARAKDCDAKYSLDLQFWYYKRSTTFQKCHSVRREFYNAEYDVFISATIGDIY